MTFATRGTPPFISPLRTGSFKILGTLSSFRKAVLALSCWSALWATQTTYAEPSRAERSLAAGYKAMFTCSAIFNGGKTTAQIAQDELSNIYPDYAEGMAATEDAIVNLPI